MAAGPRLFLSCPIDVDGSRVWFTDLWNYSIIPYLLEAVREGLQVSMTTSRPPLHWGGGGPGGRVERDYSSDRMS